MSKKLSDVLRKYLQAAPSLRAVARESGLGEDATGQLSRFVREERGITIDAVDKLAAHFDLALLPTRKTNSKK